MLAGRDFEGSGAWDHAFVANSVADGTQTIPNSVLGLRNGVVIGALNQDCAREGVLNAVDECVFVVTECLLVDFLGEAEVLLGDIVYRVELATTTGQRNALTVPLFGAPDADNSVTGEQLQRGRVNALLVDNDKVLVGAVTQFALKLDDLHDLFVGELTLTGNQFLSVFGV